MLGRMQRAEQLRHLLEPLQQAAVGAEPHRLGLEGHLRQDQRHDVERRTVPDRLALIGDHLLGDRDPTELEVDAGHARRAERLLDRRLGVLLDLRVPVDPRRLDDRGAGAVVERLHQVLLAEVQVDGALVHRRVRPLPLDEPENRAGGAVDDREGVLAARAQPEPAGGGVATLPDEAGRRPLELRQQLGALEGLGAERGGVRPAGRPLVGGGADWGSRIRGFAWSSRVASTFRPSSASGSRMKNWSSASSLAISTASP